MKRGLVVALVAALALSSRGEPGAIAGALPAFRPCGTDTPVLCGSVVVPLDPSGSRPGSVRLHVEELPTKSAPLRGSGSPKVMFMVAGGPGQASTQAFALGRAVSFWRSLFPGYTLVTYDDRGTGRSGRLSCPGLGSIVNASPTGAAPIVGGCGRRLGTKSSLYSTRTNASDMDAVRQALGVDTVSLFGVSYGTKQVLGYTLRYPSHVGRIVLDSVVSAAWPDDYYSGVLQGLPNGLDQLCRSGCRGLTGTPGADFVKLANQLAADPIVANVRHPGGRPTHVRLDGFALLELGLDTDLVPGVAVQLPADDSAALAGNPEPLERLLALDEQASSSGSLGIDFAVNVATECSDGRFFWDPASAVSARPPLLAQGLAALGPGATGPFGSWAALVGAAQECVDWPPATADTSLPAGPYPNVPVLILSGSRDVRTPTSGARLVAARFPQSRLVVIAGAGHAVTVNSRCADAVVSSWLEGRRHDGCARLPLFMTPLGAAPAPPGGGAGALSASETFKLAAYTLSEAEAMALTADGLRTEVAGLAGGALRPDGHGGATLTHYADTDGVTLDGLISPVPYVGGGWVAYVKVDGTRAVPGVLTERHVRLKATLGGRVITG